MQAKNKAWEEVQKFAHEQDGTLIYGEQALKDFITAAAVKVDQVNSEYPRCKDIKFNSHKIYNLNIYSRVDLDDAFNIEFLPIKKELPAPCRDWGRDLMGDMKADAS